METIKEEWTYNLLSNKKFHKIIDDRDKEECPMKYKTTVVKCNCIRVVVVIGQSGNTSQHKGRDRLWPQSTITRVFVHTFN